MNAAVAGKPSALLYPDNDWDFARLKTVYNAIEEIALKDLGLDVYPNQIEIISSEQMLDAYSSHGMPLMCSTGPSASTSRATSSSISAVIRASPMRS